MIVVSVTKKYAIEKLRVTNLHIESQQQNKNILCSESLPKNMYACVELEAHVCFHNLEDIKQRIFYIWDEID